MTLHRPFPEPAWRDPRLPSSRRPPAGLMGWLCDESSLTRRLQQRCGESFRVEVLSQRRERLMPSEARLLDLPHGACALVRRVHLLCGEEPWVVARTVLPDTTTRGPYRVLRRLGNRPLGGFLFSQPGLRRGPLQIAETLGGTAPVWGRRSVFYLGGRPLLVSEFFLPAFSREAFGA